MSKPYSTIIDEEEAEHRGLLRGLERGRKEGIAAVMRAVHECAPCHALAIAASDVEEWLDSSEGQAAVAAELAKIGGGT